MHRDRLIRLASRLPSCVRAIEACCGAHHPGRLLRDLGHEVRLMSPVRPYVKAQKNDDGSISGVGGCRCLSVRRMAGIVARLRRIR
jgi:transposase